MARPIRYTESFLPCMPTIARRILAASIANDRDSSELQALAEAPEAARDYLSFEVSRADGRVCATLYVRLEAEWRSRSEPVLDSDGNEWIEYHASFDVSWPSHGTTALAQAAARVELYGELVRLATRLQAEFGDRPLMRLYRTAAKRAEDEAKAAAAKAQRAVEVLAQDSGMLANLRVGGISAARRADGIPAGDYQISIKHRRFQVCVACNDGLTMAMATRVEDAAE